MNFNTREEILHWHLRDLVMWHTLALLVFGFGSLLGFLFALIPSSLQLEAVFSGIFFSFCGAVCAWRLIRLWRRLEALEKFI